MKSLINMKHELRRLSRLKYISITRIGKGVIKKRYFGKENLIISTSRTLEQFKCIYSNIEFDCKIFIVKRVDEKQLTIVKKFFHKNLKYVIAIGTGRAIDFAKILCTRESLQLHVIPTALSCNVFATNKSIL